MSEGENESRHTGLYENVLRFHPVILDLKIRKLHYVYFVAPKDVKIPRLDM